MLIALLQDLGDNYLDRGKAKAAKECYDASLKNIELFGDAIAARADLLLLRAISHRKQGKYYAELGNPWLAYQYRRKALDDSLSFFQLDSSDAYRIELANATRLVAMSEDSLWAENLEGHEDLGVSTLKHADEAIRLLDEVSDITRGQLKWLESFYYAESELASALQINRNHDAASRHRRAARDTLATLKEYSQISKRNNVRPKNGTDSRFDLESIQWRLEDLQQRLSDTMLQRSIAPNDPSMAILDELKSCELEYEKLSTYSAEMLEMQSRPLDSVKGMELIRQANYEVNRDRRKQLLTRRRVY